MGWTGEINTLEELEALMCGNVLPGTKVPGRVLQTAAKVGGETSYNIRDGDYIIRRRCVT